VSCAQAWGDLGVVRLFIDTHFFEENAANAMGVDRELPITIIITFGEGYLENDVVLGFAVQHYSRIHFFRVCQPCLPSVYTGTQGRGEAVEEPTLRPRVSAHPDRAEVPEGMMHAQAVHDDLTQVLVFGGSGWQHDQDNWPKRRMGISLPSINEKQEKAKVRCSSFDTPKSSWGQRSHHQDALSETTTQMKLRTNDVGNLVKQGYNQLAAANALEISGNDFVPPLPSLNLFELLTRVAHRHHSGFRPKLSSCSILKAETLISLS
jgi:hypothetical protein